jgi:hypothetical protein
MKSCVNVEEYERENSVFCACVDGEFGEEDKTTRVFILSFNTNDVFGVQMSFKAFGL